METEANLKILAGRIQVFSKYVDDSLKEINTTISSVSKTIKAYDRRKQHWDCGMCRRRDDK